MAYSIPALNNTWRGLKAKPFVTVSSISTALSGADFGTDSPAIPPTTGQILSGTSLLTKTGGQFEANTYLTVTGGGVAVLINNQPLLITPSSGNYFVTPYQLIATGLQSPIYTITLNGPTDGGEFGPNTIGTSTLGIQECLNACSAAGGGAAVLRSSMGAFNLQNGINLPPQISFGSDIPTPRRPNTGTGFTNKPDIVLTSNFQGVLPYPGATTNTIIGTNPTLNVYQTGYGLGFLCIDATKATIPVDGVHFTNLARGTIEYLGIKSPVNGFVSDTYPTSSPTPGETGQIGVSEGIEISAATNNGIWLIDTTQFGGQGLIQSVAGAQIGLLLQSCSKVSITQLQVSGYTQYGIVFDDAVNSCANNAISNFVCSAPGAGALFDIYGQFSSGRNNSVGNTMTGGVTGGGSTALSYPTATLGSIATRYMTLSNVIGVTDQSLNISQPIVGGSPLTAFNHNPFGVNVYIFAGAAGNIGSIAVDSNNFYTSLGSVRIQTSVYLPPESKVVINYSTAPVWFWQAVL